MGQPTCLQVSCKRSERGEVKHLSTLRKRNLWDSVSSGERKRNSLNLLHLFVGGVVGPQHETKRLSKINWKVEPKTVIAPFAKSPIALEVSRVPPDTWNPVGIWGDHPPRLNITWWPIVHSTVRERWKEPRAGEWNRILKPQAYKQWEHNVPSTSVTAYLLHNESASYFSRQG